MLEPVTLPDLFSAISSPALAVGATPCALPDGPRTDLFGRAVAPANLSVPLARKKAPPMIGISGLPGSISFASAALQLSLVSKLKARLTTDGSTLFSLTWKAKATPAGRSVSRLAASGRRTSDNDFGLWPTPNTMEGGQTSRGGKRKGELLMGGLVGWPTPNTPSGGPNVKSTPTHTGGMDLEGAVTLASWPTPIVGDTTGGPRPPDDKRGPAPGLQAAAHLTSWPALAGNALCSLPSAMKMGIALSAKISILPIALAPDQPKMNTSTKNASTGCLPGGWPTASARGWKDTTGMATTGTNPDGSTRSRLDQLPRVAGLTVIGSPAATEKPGQLNPAHSRWLMGYPAEWDVCAPTATPSSRKSRKPS